MTGRTWEDDVLMIGARSISFEGASVNETILMNKITSRIWLACVIGGILYIRNIGLRQTSSPGSYDVILVLRGDGTIELAQVVIRQREQSLKQSSTDPPTDEQIRQQDYIEYGGGCIVIQNAQILKLQKCNFTQNQGWRTEVINVQKLKNNWNFQGSKLDDYYLTLKGCQLIIFLLQHKLTKSWM
ncbi:MAG: hypothetical protein EZS28_047839 [Streblomastix strix]|uniref:Uncharacterized protein n=1 Tax=Streblomastix strix TaxID=222440 RepID=A0A5J4TDY5_9EUKA|nr:MAG: hypothetical protein EZS28_047839 [Streblomastix strix]